MTDYERGYLAALQHIEQETIPKCYEESRMAIPGNERFIERLKSFLINESINIEKETETSIEERCL